MAVLTLERGLERQILPSWVDSFIEYTAKKQTSERFRRWAAISVIAAAIERKVWLKTASGDLYPHLFIILVGRPAAGKGVALNAAVGLFKTLVTKEGPYIAPTSMSAASFSDALKVSIRKILRPMEIPNFSEFNSLYIPSRELTVLLPQYDNLFMATLTDIYDGEEYRQTRRGKEIDFTIPCPQVNILAATTPSSLNKFLPAGAFEEGFISRTILIYSGSTKAESLLDESIGNGRLHRDLVNDLKIIAGHYGKMGFSKDAARSINDWYLSGCEPSPSHPKLFSYVERRPAHLMKLCIVATLMRADNRFEIEMQDLELARAWLEEAEDNMEDVFKAMSSNISDNSVIEEARHFVWQTTLKEKRNLSEDRLWYFLQEKMPSHNILRVIEAMVKGNIITAVHGPTSVSYTATARKR